MSGIKEQQGYQDNGVWISAKALERFGTFEQEYLAARDKEQRIFSIEDIRRLPEVPAGYRHEAEWRMRKRSIARFLEYLEGRRPVTVMDIGCGNGFFSNAISRYATGVYGIDVNLKELQQAAVAFAGNPKLQWYCADVMDETLFTASSADLITFCCSFQYFPDAAVILDRCLELLRPGGAVHIIDTPFYHTGDAGRAKTATEMYYNSLGSNGLAAYYFHHTWEQIDRYRPLIRYRPPGGLRAALFGKNDSPFPWIEIRKP